MKKFIELIINTIESYRKSMDRYGTARIIVCESLTNNNIKKESIVMNDSIKHLHIVKTNQN